MEDDSRWQCAAHDKSHGELSHSQLLAPVDFAVTNPSFTVRRVESELGLSYGRANKVGQLVDLGVLQTIGARGYNRRFFGPRVLDVLLGTTQTAGQP